MLTYFDEAHRGQYGFDEKIVMSENEKGKKEAHMCLKQS